MSVRFRNLLSAVAGVFLFTIACGDNGPTSTGGPVPPVSTTTPVLTIGGGADEAGFAARRTPDGGYLIVGSIGKPADFFTDLLAVRTDANGELIGSYPVRRGETSSSIWASVLTSDGGIVAITTRDGEAILIKFASDGSVAWERSYGTHPGTSWYSLCTAGDGFLVTVLPDVFSDPNTVSLFLTNADGTQRSHDEWVSSPRRIFAAAEAADGSFLLAGSQWTTPSNLDVFVMRTTPGTTTERWAKTFGTGNNDHAVRAVALGNDVVLFGTMDDPPEPAQNGYFYLMRLDVDGNEVWAHDISTLGYVMDMRAAYGGGIAAAIHHQPGGWKIAHLNGDGSVSWERSLETGSDRGGIRYVTSDASGYLATGAGGTDAGTDIDILFARTDAMGNTIPFTVRDPECMDPVTPPPPSNVQGTQRTFSMVHDTGGGGMEAIWAWSPDFVMAVGDSGHIAHFDGTTWSQMVSNTREELYDVFGFARDDVFVAARHGKIFHYDGVSWSEMPSTATYLRSLWGSSPDDVWAAGVQLMHYDGAAWSDRTPKGWRTPIDMDGITATDIYTVGAAGEVQHFDGCTWSTVHTAPDRLYGVSAIPGPLVHAVGDAGLVVRYDGITWETLDLQTNHYFTSVCARSARDVFIGGTSTFAGPYALYWFDGTSWVEQTQASSQALLDVTVTSDGHFFGVTSWSQIVRGTP